MSEDRSHRKILVLGASGLIGRFVTDDLRARGFHVTGVARKFAASQKSTSFDLERPILAEVPLIATFTGNHEYRAYVHYQSGFMGVLIAEQPDPPAGNPITAGALVYSPEFSAYEQKSKHRKKAAR